MNAMQDPKFITVKKAAELIGCTVGRVHQLIAEAAIVGLQPNGEHTFWLLEKKSVEKVAKSQAKTGRPRSNAEKN